MKSGCPLTKEAHVGVRVLLVKAFKVNEITRYSDYRKFNVGTAAATSGQPMWPLLYDIDFL